VPTFPIRYGTLSGPFLGVLGLGRRFSRVEVADDMLRVRMGWGFRGETPCASVVRAVPGKTVALTRGVHGWRGSWLVNGAGDGIVEITLDPPMRARTIGFPLRVSQLAVSVEDPSALLAALT